MFSQQLDETRKAELLNHVASCADCASVHDQTEQILSIASATSVPDPGEAFWDGFYDGVTARISREDHIPETSFSLSPGWLKDILLPRTPALQLAYACCLVLLGVFLGRMIFTTESDPETQFAQSNQQGSQIQTVSLDQRTGRFLDRSKVLLLGIVNLDTEEASQDGYNLNRSRLVANELVKESDTLRRELEASDEQRLIKLMDDLEVILLQIANLEEQADVPAIEMVKDGVDQRGVLLKINVTEMRNDFTRDGS